MAGPICFAIGIITNDERQTRVREGYQRMLDDMAASAAGKPLHDEVTDILATIRAKDAQQARVRADHVQRYGRPAA